MSSYSVSNYGRMIEPGPRLEAYVRAMRDAIRPGVVVTEIGTGTGFFAVLAARLGADRVYAIEPEESIQVGREMARANGVEDRITFIHGLSTETELDEKADVLISDLRGALPLYGLHIPSIVDARERLLKPGGAIMPLQDTIRVAVAHDPKSYREHVEPWSPPPEGMAMEPHRQRAVNSWFVQRVERQHLRTDPTTWVELDYATVDSPNVEERIGWEVGRAGTAHGLSVWFDASIGPGIGFTTGPDGPELVYGSAFFPFENPLDLLAGDRLHVDLRASLVGDDYTWVWNSRLVGADGAERAAFDQSTVRGAPVTADRLRQRAGDFRPQLSDDGTIDRFILGQMNGGRTLSQIAEEAHEQFPGQFESAAEALTRVGDLSVRYGGSR